MERFAARPGGILLILVFLSTFIQTILIERYACSTDMRLGNTYVDIRKLTSRDVKKIGKPLTHPHEISDDIAAKVLSSISYREKGLFKSKKTRQAVFMSAEVRKLAPLVADAFSKASTSDYVVVYSSFDRALLSDLHTYCMMFITGNELNVAFTAVRQKLSYNITESEKGRIEKLFDKPVDIKKSAFWELVPVDGQRLKEGHQNWLLVDLRGIVVGKPVARGKARGQVLPDTANVGAIHELPLQYEGELEERVKRLEEKAGAESVERLRALPEAADEDAYIRVDAAKDYMPRHGQTSLPLNEVKGLSMPPSVEEREIEELRNLGIKEKLIRLRALRDEGLITEGDYRSKKAQLIREEQKDKSIREKLKELRDMRDEELITGKDYESLKKELLDKWF